MCGISGFIDFTGKSGRDVLVGMVDCLVHRGPDDSGYHVVQHDNYTLGLGQRRLSILDLSPLGHQPMFFENLCIVFNGEIYNFQEIRQELIAQGHSFISGGDTEVILKAFKTWGPSCVQRFIGMFAFVIHDTNTNKVYIYRDRAGVKPLFYYWHNNVLLFSSELKSFHKHPAFEKTLDYNHLALYLQYNYVPGPYSIFKNTTKLSPGHYLEIDLQKRSVVTHQYWNVLDYYNQEKLKISKEEAIEETERLLKSAFEYRMVSDVPVGVFLSGGYDSTAIAALLQKGRTEKIKTFTIGFDVEGFDEAPEAKKIANFLGTDHTEHYCTPQEAFSIIPTLPDIYDEPFADNSTVPTVLVSKLARQSVKVALSGDAGDEIFGGYYKFIQSVELTSQFPKPVQRTLAGMMSMVNPEKLPYLKDRYNFSTRFEKVTEIWRSGNPLTALKQISHYITGTELKQYMKHSFLLPPTDFDLEKDMLDNNDAFNKMLAIDYRTFLVDNNLVKVDRATMSVGLEGREPFLDHRLIEFVSRLPSSYKINGKEKKVLLRDIVHRHVDKPLMDRPKKPFIAPLTVWFRQELKDYFLHYLSEDNLKKGDFFNPAPIIALRDRYLSGAQVNHQKLWNILIFQMWKEKWL
jgi:asparagine synthase (glutamine-hydrolysing)